MTELTLGRLRITPGFLLGFSLLLTCDSGGLLLALLLAGFCHELGHYFVAQWLGLEIRYLRLSFFGAELSLPGRSSCTWGQETLLLAAGPAVNLLLSGLCFALPDGNASLFGAINLLLGCFNLLPVSPLDGGGLLAVLSARLLPGSWGLTISDCVGGITRGMLLGLGVFLALKGNPSLLSVALWLIWGAD